VTTKFVQSVYEKNYAIKLLFKTINGLRYIDVTYKKTNALRYYEVSFQNLTLNAFLKRLFEKKNNAFRFVEVTFWRKKN
jgi:hypothetical protein